MIKLLSYQTPSEIQKHSDLKEIFKNEIQLLGVTEANAKDAIKMEFDILEIPMTSFKYFIPELKVMSISAYNVQLADGFVRLKNGVVKEVNSLALAVLQCISQQVHNLDTSGRVLICGKADFLISLTQQFYQTGFVKFILSPIDSSFSSEQLKQLRKKHFNIEVNLCKIEELNQLSILSDIMIINIEEFKDEDLYESLSYFNFLNRNSIFIDLQDHLYPELRDEAKRTDLQVIDSLKVHRQRYKYLIDLIKNTP